MIKSKNIKKIQSLIDEVRLTGKAKALNRNCLLERGDNLIDDLKKGGNVDAGEVYSISGDGYIDKADAADLADYIQIDN